MNGGEGCILGHCQSAVDRLEYMKSNGLISQHILKSLQKTKVNEDFLYNNCTSDQNNVIDSGEENKDDEDRDINSLNSDCNDEDEYNLTMSDIHVQNAAETDDNFSDDDMKFEERLGLSRDNTHWEADTSNEGYQSAIVLKLTKQQYKECYDSTSNWLTEHMQELKRKNQVSANMTAAVRLADHDLPLTDGCTKINVDDYENRKSRLSDMVYSKFTQGQKESFATAASYICNGTGEFRQLVQFIHGAGGTGKSLLVESIIELARLEYGKQKELYGSNVLIVAPTGAAAHNIGGSTWQSALKLPFRKGKKLTSNDRRTNQNSATEVGRNIEGVKLLVIDEISMISLQSLYTMDKLFKAGLIANLKVTGQEYENAVKEINSRPFGGAHIIFLGDLWQLKPVAKYEKATPVFGVPIDSERLRGKAIWDSINEHSELFESTRDQGNDAVFTNFLLHEGRTGNATVESVDYINNKCIKWLSTEDTINNVNRKAMYLAATIEEVKKINSAYFQTLIHEGAFKQKIHALHEPANPGVRVPNAAKQAELLRIGQKDGVKSTLNLAIGTRIKINENLATEIGLFNGAMGTIVGFGYKGKIPNANDEEATYQNSISKEMPVLFVQMDQEGFKYSFFNGRDGIERIVPIVPKSYPLNKDYRRLQYPIDVAHASTVHSAQGLTAKYGAVIKPSENRKPFTYGIEYVAVSRVTSIEICVYWKN